MNQRSTNKDYDIQSRNLVDSAIFAANMTAEMIM